MQATAVGFQVWQDFMPGIPSGGPPLHAIITIEVSGTKRLNTANTGGTITITRPSGEVITTATLALNEQSDDLGLAQPGPRRLVFAMESTSISAKLTENEILRGTARLQLAGQEFTLALPETQVMFTH